MSNDVCVYCKYKVINTREPGRVLCCVNQNSQNFGKELVEKCSEYDEFKSFPDMPFKDALEEVIMLPSGAYPSYFFKFDKEDELDRPFMCISFTDNAQMLEYRDAHCRCFDELMRMKRDAGDFDKEDDNEITNDH